MHEHKSHFHPEIELPMFLQMPICPLCEEPVVMNEPTIGGPVFGVCVHGIEKNGEATIHRECAFRQVMGGIGHLEDHDFWCQQMHDPDGGLSYRESARRVWDRLQNGR